MQNAKVAISTTLLSVVVLATIGNSSLLSKKNVETRARSLAESYHESGGRAIASIPTGTTEAEDSLVNRLATKELSAGAMIGHQPSDLQRLSIGYLEGNYSLQLENGKLHELQFTSSADSTSGETRSPKHVEDLVAFIENNRALLPVVFEKSVKLASQKDGETISQSFELVNKLNMPVAKVQFLTNLSGGLIAMSVDQVASVSK